MENSGIVTLDLFAIVVAGILCYSNSLMYYGDRRHKRVFSFILLFNIISLATHALYSSGILAGVPILQAVDDVLLVISFYMVELLFAEFVFSELPSLNRINRILRVLIHFEVLVCMVLWILPIFDILDVTDSWLLSFGQIPGWMVTALIIVLILSNWNRLGSRNSVFYLIYLSIPMIGMTLRNITGLSGLQHCATTISLLMVHSVVNTEQSKALQEERHQNEVNKTRIMLTQIKPHFIYNSLNTIYYLCEKDPKEAQKAIEEFSSYLRGNLDSLTREALIPFSRELEHIQHYLYLEKLRYSDDLHVEYDIRCTEFKVPALSIQLLVENAVKHGIGHKPGGGTVRISSREEENACAVTVSDDGIGFDPQAIETEDDTRSHIGLTSMRARVHNAGGTVEIESIPDQGTIITVRMPNGQDRGKA